MDRLLTLALVFAFTACDTAEPPDYDDLTGSHSGTIRGTGDGISLHGGVTLSLTQSEGHFSGTGTIVFEATDGGFVLLWRASANVDGALSDGRNPRISLNVPQISIDVGRPFCSGTTTLSGTHSSQGGQTQLSGVVTLMTDSCRQPWVTLNVTVSLS